MQKRASLSGEDDHVPLKTLNSYTSRFKVKVRLLEKTPRTEFVNKRTNGQGSVFSTTIIDGEGTLMQCKFWNDCYDYDKLVVNNVYEIAHPAKIQISNKRYSNVKHNYSLSFDTSCTKINITDLGSSEEEFRQLPSSLPVNYMCLRSIKLANTKLPYNTSIKGFLTNVTADNNIVTVTDATKHAIDVFLWDNFRQIKMQEDQLVLFLNFSVRFNKNNNLILSSTRSSQIYLYDYGRDVATSYDSNANPSVIENWSVQCQETPPPGMASFTEISSLVDWYKQPDSSENVQHLSRGTNQMTTNPKNLVETNLKDFSEEMNKTDIDENTVYKIVAFISGVNFSNDIIYKSCNTCNKKIPDDGVCKICQTTVENHSTKMLTTLRLTDYTVSDYSVRIFSNTAQAILNKSPNHVKTLITNNETNQINELFNYIPLWRKYILLIRSRKDTYNNQIRNNVNIVNVLPFDHASYVSTFTKLSTLFNDECMNAAAVPEAKIANPFASQSKRVKTGENNSTEK